MPALDCPEELMLIERSLQGLGGLSGVHPDYFRRLLRVDYDPAQLDPETLAQAIRRSGFAVSAADDDSASDLGWGQRHGRTLFLSLGAALLVMAAVARLLVGETTTLVAALAVAATAVSGYRVAWAGLRAIRLRALDMNALMTIAATGAILIGDYFEAATAMFLFGVALGLESMSLDRARHAVRTLVELTPTLAHRLAPTPGDVDPQEIEIGDVVLIKPGERCPVDGTVLSGQSALNQAPLTGESVPVEKGPGDNVFAGSLNGSGSLEVRVEKPAGESLLAHIGRLVEQAQSSRSPTERFVDRFARRYTPAVILLAIALAFGPPLLAWAGVWPAALDGVTLADWFHRGLVLLVIACPCALVISTPVTIVCGLYQAARRGMLIKGGEHLENAGRVDFVAFDKTGTLTVGRPEVARVDTVGSESASRILQIAASLEQHSEHPLAEGIVAAARRDGLVLTEPKAFTGLQGLGIEGTLDGQTYYLGSPRLFADYGLPTEGYANGRSSENDLELGHELTVLLGTRERLLGALILVDRAREEAAEGIAALKRLGVRGVAMLTGDSDPIARRIAEQLGIDEVRAELLPDQKVDAVHDLARRYPQLAMVGDGVNDAPALVAARVGVALGSEASDTTLETADVVIVTPRLSRVAELLTLGQRCRRLLRQNIAIALGIKALVLVLAALGMATMWMAVAADVGASLVVIFNGMRLIGGPAGVTSGAGTCRHGCRQGGQASGSEETAVDEAVA